MRRSLYMPVFLLACSSVDPIIDGGGALSDATIDATGVDGNPACGVASPLATCFGGAFFADCGGTGTPVLACADDADCRWFSGGCVASGYSPSSCSSADICCQGNWPFVRDSGSVIQAELSHDLYAFGTLPWDRARGMNVSILVDPDLVPSTSVCSGTVPGGTGVCTGGVSTTSAPGLLVTWLRPESALWGWALVVEADVAASTPVARVCVAPFTDVVELQCSTLEMDCAVSGTVTVAAMPSSILHGHVDVAFGSGLSWSGDI